MKQACNKCHKHYNILTNEGICFYCHVDKYGIAPNKKQFGGHDK